MEFFKQIADWMKAVVPKFKAGGVEGTPYDRSTAKPKSKNVSGDGKRGDLVKSRPVNLHERYRIVEDTRQVESVFKHIAAPLLGFCDDWSESSRNSGATKIVLRELGTTDDKRSFLYMKPMSSDGLLMERSGAGWRISKAEKIIGRHMFMRSHQDPWDLVTVWSDPKGEGLTRLRSLRFSQELISVSEYERRLTEALNEFFEAGAEQ